MASAPLPPSTAHASFFLGQVPLELCRRECWDRHGDTTQGTRLLTTKSPRFTSHWNHQDLQLIHTRPPCRPQVAHVNTPASSAAPRVGPRQQPLSSPSPERKQVLPADARPAWTRGGGSPFPSNCSVRGEHTPLVSPNRPRAALRGLRPSAPWPPSLVRCPPGPVLSQGGLSPRVLSRGGGRGHSHGAQPTDLPKALSHQLPAHWHVSQ